MCIYLYASRMQSDICPLLVSQVIDVKSSFVNMVPSKVEVTMQKADAVVWGKLEDPKHKPVPEVTDEMNAEQEDVKPDWYISDDDISESDWEDEEEDKKSEEKKEEKQADEGPPELEEPTAVPPEKWTVTQDLYKRGAAAFMQFFVSFLTLLLSAKIYCTVCHCA